MKSNILRKGWSALLAVALGATALAGSIIAAPAAKAASEAIDPSDISKWYLYDHTDYGTEAEWLNDAYGYSLSMHPYQYVNDSSGAARPSSPTYTSIKAQTSAYRLPHHIWIDGSASDAEVLFQGYGVQGTNDFMLYPTKSKDIKTINFYIDMKNIGAHTLQGFGALLNTDIDASGKLHGYAIYYDVKDSNVYLMELFDQDAKAFSDGKSSVNKTDARGHVIDKTKVNAKSIGKFSAAKGNKYHVRLEIDEYSFTMSHSLCNSSGSPTTYTDMTLSGNTEIPLPSSKNQGFGLMVDYEPHGCSMLSTVIYSSMQMSIDYSVVFDPNGGELKSRDDGQAPGDKYRVDGVKPGYSFDTNTPKITMPNNPEKDGYVFGGWKIVTGTNAGDIFTSGTKLDKGTGVLNVEAIWDEIKQVGNVTYDPSNSAWVNTDVKATVTFTTNIRPDYVKDSSDEYSEAKGNMKVTPNAAGTEYTVTLEKIYTGNTPVAETFTLTSTDTVANKNYTVTTTATVNWIDKGAPTITNLPDVSGTTGNQMKGSDLQKVVFTDPVEMATGGLNNKTSSEINKDSQKLLLFHVDENGNVSSKPDRVIDWKDIGDINTKGSAAYVEPGRYYYDVYVEDNATNNATATGASYDPTNNNYTPNPGGGGLIDNEGKPEGPNAGGKVDENNPPPVFNALGPNVTVTVDGKNNGQNGGDLWYTDDVTVTVTGKQETLPLKELETDTNGAKDPSNTTIAGGLENEFTLKEDGVYTITGTTKDEAGLTASDGPKTIQIDRTPPTLEFKPDPSAPKDLDSVVIDPKDNPPAGKDGIKTSEVDDDTISLVIKDKDGNVVVTVTDKTKDNVKDIIRDLPTGEYYIEDATVKDNAGNTSDKVNLGDKDDPFWHEKPGDTIVTVDLGYTPNGPAYTAGTVDVNYTVTSKLPITSVKVDGSVVFTGPGSYDPTDGLYKYSGVTTTTKNYDPVIDVTTIGKTPGGKTGEVSWIDTIPPTIAMPSSGKLDEVPVGHWGTAFADPNDPSYGKKSVASGVKVGSQVFTITNSAGQTVSGSDWATVVADAKSAWSMVSGTVTVTVTVSDNVDNVGTESLGGFTMTPSAITPPTPAGLTVSVGGGESVLSTGRRNSPITFNSSDPAAVVTVTKAGSPAAPSDYYCVDDGQGMFTFIPTQRATYVVTFSSGPDSVSFTVKVIR